MKKVHSLIIFLLLLKLSLVLCSFHEASCFWRINHNKTLEDNVKRSCGFILFTLPVHLVEDYFRVLLNFALPVNIYQYVLVMLFAIEEINKHPNLLPNSTLGFAFLGDQCDITVANFNNLNMFSKYGKMLPNYICEYSDCDVALTGPTWTASAQVGTLLQLFTFPQVTYGPFHDSLSGHDMFPHIYQVASKDTSLVLAMVSLMIHFSWNWVGLVILGDDQGVQFLLDVRGEMKINGVCLAFVNVIPVNMQLYIQRAETYYHQIMTSSANVVILYGNLNSTLEVSFRRWQTLGIRRLWVTTSQWDAISRTRDFSTDSFHGTFTFSHHYQEIPTFKHFIQKISVSAYPEGVSLLRLGWIYFNCSVSVSDCKTLNHCSSNTSLEWLPWHNFDMAMNDEHYNIYNAVYAVAHAFHNMQLQQLDINVMESWKGMTLKCLQVNTFLKNLKFVNPVGDPVNINQTEKVDAMYDILTVLNFLQGYVLKVKIGQFYPYFSHDQQLFVYEDMIEWATGSRQLSNSVCSIPCYPGFKKSHQEGKADCCFDCSRCPENEISNTTDMELCVKCPEDWYANAEQTYCLPKAVTFLAYEDPLGMALVCMALCFSALTALVLGVFVKHKDTPIVKANNCTLSYILLISLTFCFLCPLLFIGNPNTTTCILQQITFGTLFSVALSTVLAKTITVLLAFRITVPERRMRGLLVSRVPKYIIPICTLVQIILCGIWLKTSPPFVDTDVHSEHGHITITCSKGSVTAFYCVLGYLGSLALASFLVAFLARNLPDRFNEAKFLTFSMLVFCSVWVTFLPVYHSTKGKVMVAVEVFSILSSSAGLLGCIFIPKCYIILLRPDRNSIQKFKDKTFN
ncbi:vomeronasal type-2 receptor 116-like isoform X2 [Acomys russatus]|uniref:vomeronasal type-2 receptor 116-like isoform X2 n=1 Tax=Acomys russatus TaxID=60746 RepID=UPI0021E2EE5E|nr:vomeronasal type-2 receptor 116-like isoform X2 [Acomys russatus]